MSSCHCGGTCSLCKADREFDRDLTLDRIADALEQIAAALTPRPQPDGPCMCGMYTLHNRSQHDDRRRAANTTYTSGTTGRATLPT